MNSFSPQLDTNTITAHEILFAKSVPERKGETLSYNEIVQRFSESTAKREVIQEVATDSKTKEVFKPYTSRKSDKEKIFKLRFKLITLNCLIFATGLLALFVYNMTAISTLKLKLNHISSASTSINYYTNTPSDSLIYNIK